MLPFDKPVISPIVIGREQEVNFLTTALDRARRGSGQCVLVAGEAGIGKSRLVAEVGRQADRLGFGIFRGLCFEPESSFPYGPVVDGLRAVFAGRDQAEIGQLVGSLGPELVKLVPELTLLLPGVRPSPALEPEAESRRLFEVLTRSLWQFAGNRPLLIVFEDLHWSDRASRDFIYFLARRTQNRPALLLLTYRVEEAGRIGQFLGRLNRERLAVQLVLGPIEAAEVDLMVRAVFGVSQPTRRDVVDLLYRLTEGNPFFIEEVLKGWLAAGSIYRTETGIEWAPVEELAVPRNVQDAVRQRLPRLADEARELLNVAAVAGQRFELETLCELTGQDEAAVVKSIKELVTAQLVVEVTPGTFAFRHPLTREAVYTGLLSSERRLIHRRIVEFLERVYAGRLDACLADLAYHCYAGGWWERALEFGIRAGERAAVLYAPYEAIEHLTRALGAAERLSIFPPLQVLRARGKAREMVGYIDQAGQDYEEVLRLAREAGNRLAEWQALLDLGSVWNARDQTVAGEYFQNALALARELGDPAILAGTLNAVGDWHRQTGKPGQAVGFHQEALATFERLGDQKGVARALRLLGMAANLNGDLVQAREYLERAAGLLRRLGDREELVLALTFLAGCGGSHQHDLEAPAMGLGRAIAVGEEAVRTARGISLRWAEAFAMAELVLPLILKGEYQRAVDLGQAALSLAEDIGQRQWIVATCRSLGRLYQDLLAWERARTHFERAYRLLAELGSDLWEGYVTAGLVLTCIAQGELDRAKWLLDRVLKPDLPAEARWQRQAWGAAAELALARGDPEFALAIAEKIKAATRNLGPGTVVPRLWFLQATALTRLRRFAEAEALLLAAERAASERGLPGWVWRLRLGLGLLYRAWGRREDAPGHLLVARRVVQELAGGIADRELRAQFLSRAAAMVPPVGRGSPQRAGLTAREWQVARLISQGKSNREIAEALFISERTVETHVASIMAKLKFPSRARIAAWVIEQEAEA